MTRKIDTQWVGHEGTLQFCIIGKSKCHDMMRSSFVSLHHEGDVVCSLFIMFWLADAVQVLTKTEFMQEKNEKGIF